MATYRRVYDSRHLQADCREPGSALYGTLRSVIEYGLPLPFYCSVLFFSRRRCDGWQHHGRSFSIYPPAAVMRDTGRMHRCCQCHLPNSVEFIDTEQRSDGRTDARQFHNFTHTMWALAINFLTITVFTFSFFVLYFLGVGSVR